MQHLQEQVRAGRAHQHHLAMTAQHHPPQGPAAALDEAGRNQAFNIVNGDIFRWRWLWPKLAADFGIEAAPYPGRRAPLEPQLADMGPVWATLAAKHSLAEADLSKPPSPSHTDLNLGP